MWKYLLLLSRVYKMGSRRLLRSFSLMKIISILAWFSMPVVFPWLQCGIAGYQSSVQSASRQSQAYSTPGGCHLQYLCCRLFHLLMPACRSLSGWWVYIPLNANFFPFLRPVCGWAASLIGKFFQIPVQNNENRHISYIIVFILVQIFCFSNAKGKIKKLESITINQNRYHAWTKNPCKSGFSGK